VILCGIGNDEEIALKDGVGAEGDITRHLAGGQARLGLEPLPVGIDQTDHRNGRAADIRSQGGYIVELGFRRTVKNAVAVECLEPQIFIFW
jgi:hypothetical protein